MSITKLHKAARDFAKAGIPVFPCAVNSKVPATENGWHDATTDLDQIDTWWRTADYNIAFNPHAVGWGVVDIDGPEGERAWTELQAEQGVLPDTYEVRTPRGGRHLYLQGELPMTAWRPGVKRCLGEHIDTRGVGSYVLAPPSRVVDVEKGIDGSYEVLHDRDLAHVPVWMPTKLERRDNQAKAVIGDLDLEGNIRRGQSFLSDLVKRGDVAISGRGGNNRTYQVACDVLNLGLTPPTAGKLLADIWNPHCIPPWTLDELGAIIANASNYAQNEAGAWAVAPAAEVFGSALDSILPTLKEQSAQRSRFHFEDEAEQEQGKDAPFLIDRLIPDATTILLVGAKGSFKSFIAQHILLSLAANKPMFGVEPARHGPTFMGAHEGRNEMKRARRQAWKLAHEIVAPVPFYIAPGPRVIDDAECEEFREQIRVQLRKGSQRIAAIGLDTVAKCMSGLDENFAGDVGRFVSFCDSLVTEFECPVLALHHTGKAGGKSSRGSSALEAGFGTVIDIERAGKSKAVAVSVRYHKDAEEPEKPWTFEGQVVGGSLVFTPISGADYKAKTLEDDPFERTHVGAALKKLGAVGRENAVSTMILAGEMTPAVENEKLETRNAAVTKSQRILSTLSHKSLAAYCTKEGRDLVWWLPCQDQGAEGNND